MKSSLLRFVTAMSVSLAMFACSLESKRERALKLAEKHFSAGDYQKAEIEYKNVLQLDPQNVIAIEHLGTIWLDRGAPLRALTFLFKNKELSASNYNARTKIASALRALGKLDEARKETLAILEGYGAAGDALVLLTETMRTKEDYDVAVRKLGKFFQQDSYAYQLASANLLLAKGDLAAAKKILQRALEAEPKRAALHSALGTLFLRQDDISKAEVELKLAAELSPRRSSERMRYAEFKVQTGPLPDAVAYLKELVRQAPDFLSPRRLLSQVAFTEKKYDEAQAYLNEIFVQDPSNLEAHLLQAQILLSTGESKQAVAALERLSKANPAFDVINHHLAQALLQDDSPALAAEVLRRGLAMNPERADSIILLAEIDLRAGNPESVLPAMALLLQKYPNMVKAQLLLVDALRRMQRLSEAAAVVSEQIKAYPKTPIPHMLLGSILRQQKKLPEAKQTFEHVLTMAPKNLAAANALVDIEIEEQDFETAMRRSQAFWQNDPTAAEAYLMEGRIHFAQGNWERAETALQNALVKSPSLHDAYDLILKTYVSSNRLPQAITQLESGLADKPNDSRLLMLSGIVYEQMNDTTRAKAAYERLLLTHPDAVAALNNLAYLTSEDPSELDRAQQLASRARKLAPDSAEVGDTLGWILFRRKDHTKALELIAESARKRPQSPVIQFHLGMASLALDQKEAALKAFRTALSAPTDFRDKAEARRQLAMLETDSSVPPVPSRQEPGP